ncbi:MAG: amidohydrolase family protein [Proteobacteria bacterium]|nr:amidohydrolase family protein [Pseudomonadota bacterium]
MSSPPFGLFDADGHYYEPRDCFTRYIEPKMRERAVHVREGADGQEEIWVGERPCVWIETLFGFERTAKPGALEEQIRLAGTEEYSEGVELEIGPETRDPEARLALMDEQGIERSLLFPSLGVCVEAYMERDAEQTYANLHAFNRWLDDDWGFVHRDRLYAAPMLSLLDVERATRELDWLLERGARLVCLKPGPVSGRSPADPHFDPVWSRLAEAGVAAAYHSGNAGYTQWFSPLWGENGSPAAHAMSAHQWVTCFADRPIMDTLGALVFHNLFGRHPGLRVLSVENGSLWVDYLLNTMDRMVGMARNGPWPGGRLSERPSDIFRRHVSVSPFPYDDIVALAARIGSERVLFGSDYTHPEGLAEPAAYGGRIAELPEADQRRILRDNALELIAA